MKKTDILTAVSVLLFMFYGSVSSGTEGSSFSDIQRILDNGRLLVAILAKDAPPMIMTDSQGEITGFEADLARDIGKKIGVPVEFIRTAETYDEVIDIVAQKKADIAVSFLSSDVRRAKKVLFSKPYVKQNHKFFFNRELFVRLKRKYGTESLWRKLQRHRLLQRLRSGFWKAVSIRRHYKEIFPSYRSSSIKVCRRLCRLSEREKFWPVCMVSFSYNSLCVCILKLQSTSGLIQK